MKNKNAFTLIEFLIIIAIVGFLVGILLPAFQTARKKAEQQRQEQTNPSPTFQVGDTIYIEEMGVTGKVASIYNSFQYPIAVNILVKGSNGVPVVVENINTALLKKVQPVENWK